MDDKADIVAQAFFVALAVAGLVVLSVTIFERVRKSRIKPVQRPGDAGIRPFIRSLIK